MADPIAPRSLSLERAQRVVESGQPIHQFQAWPDGTAAGQLLLREVQRLQAARTATRQLEISHAHA